jgi:hypothetical protein
MQAELASGCVCAFVVCNGPILRAGAVIVAVGRVSACQ